MTDAQWKDWLEDSTAQRVTLYQLDVLSGDTPTTLYLSNRAYGNGDPANPYQAIISQNLKIVQAITRDGVRGIQFGNLGVWNVDGSRDGWLDYVFKNREMRAYVGDVRWPFADFRLESVCTMEDASGNDDPDQITIETRDALQRINTPVSEVLLPDGSLCPVTIGEACNVTLKLKNAATREYAHHTGASEGAIEARVEAKKRDAITQNVGAGTVTFLTNTEVGTVTASVQGDKMGGIYRCTIASLVKLLCMSYGEPARRFIESDFDAANIAAFESVNPQKVGLHLSERTTVKEACDRLTASLQAALVPSRTGKLRIVQWGIPATATASILPAHYTAAGIRPVERHPVAAAVKIGYCRNYTVQASLQTSIPEAHKALFAAPWRTKTAVDEATRARYKLTTDPVLVETCLNHEDDAQAEAARRLAQDKVPRTTYALEGHPIAMLLELGQGVTVYGSRYGMAAGKLGQITMLALDLGTYNTEIQAVI